MTASFARMATVTASTKRNPLTGGKRSGFVTNLSSLKITPLAPLDISRASDLRQMLKLQTAYRIFETYAQGNPDVADGDLLVVSGTEYPIRAVLPWTFHDDVRVNIIVEEVRA